MSKPIAMRDALLRELIPHMESDSSIFFLTADFGSPVLDEIRERFPDNFLNVGIAEQNLINVATGLALEGFKVIAYAIAPFITMRCYEQIRVNLAILGQVRPLNVTLVGVGAGYSYVVSGPTHQCLEDLSIMRTLPNVELFSPSDWVSAAKLLPVAMKETGIKYFRLDAQPLTSLYPEDVAPDFSDGFHEFCKGSDVCVVSTGFMTRSAIQAAMALADEGLDVGVIDLYTFSSFNRQKLADTLSHYAHVITYEEGFIGKGGLDSLILHLLNEYKLAASFDHLGLQPEYNFQLGTRERLHQLANAAPDNLCEKIRGYSA